VHKKREDVRVKKGDGKGNSGKRRDRERIEVKWSD